MINISLVKEKKIPLVGLGILIYSALFLLVFQPFGKIMHHGDPVLIIAILGYGFVAALVYVIFEYFLRPVVFLYISPDRLYAKLFWYIFIVLSIGVANYTYKVILGSPKSWIDLGITIYRTATLSVFPFMTLIIIGYLQELYGSNSKFSLSSENGRDHLHLDAKELLYIKSQDNYSSIVTEKNGTARSILLRGSLTFFQSQIKDDNVVRCQRSFLINLKRVRKFAHNSKTGVIELDGPTDPVPVSKKYLDQIRTRLS